MAEAILSLCWKDYTSELATLYESFLETKFLVDCTISAEGQSLKAHRLVLSACSPYFNMLFHEETGKHPFIILVDASFETLKAMIDFIYRGETQISEKNLKAFLNLGQSLQIKGLKVLSKNYKNKNKCSNVTGNIPQGPFVVNQDSCEVEIITANRKDSPENSFQPYRSPDYPDVVHTNSSAPFQGYSASCEEVQSVSVIPLQEYRRSLGRDTEITVKHEPLYATFSKPRNEILNDESMSGNFACETDASICDEEDLNQFSSCCEYSRGNLKSPVMPPSQQQQMQINDEVSSGRDVTWLPVNLVPNVEHLEDEIGVMNDPVGYNTNEADEETNPTHEQNTDQNPGAEDPPSELQDAYRKLGGERRRQQEDKTTSSDQQKRVNNLGRTSRWTCRDCPATFISYNGLKYHKVQHTGKGSYLCNVCNKAFARASCRATHKRTHTGERPYRCDVCSKSFAQRGTFSRHILTHTGVRPYQCDVCNKAFSRLSTLATHMRTHTKERPYRCGVCEMESPPQPVIIITNENTRKNDNKAL